MKCTFSALMGWLNLIGLEALENLLNSWHLFKSPDLFNGWPIFPQKFI